jgi:hypothetical protein
VLHGVNLVGWLVTDLCECEHLSHIQRDKCVAALRKRTKPKKIHIRAMDLKKNA